MSGRELICEDDRLHSGDFKSLAATQVFAGHEIIFADHIGARFGEPGSIPLVGAGRKISFFGAHQPGDFVVRSLMAVRTVERRRFLFRTLVEKIALFHKRGASSRRHTAAARMLTLHNHLNYCTLLRVGCNGERQQVTSIRKYVCQRNASLNRFARSKPSKLPRGRESGESIRRR